MNIYHAEIHDPQWKGDAGLHDMVLASDAKTRDYQIVTMLEYLVSECAYHNNEYHHVTPKDLLEKAEQLIRSLTYDGR